MNFMGVSYWILASGASNGSAKGVKDWLSLNNSQ